MKSITGVLLVAAMVAAAETVSLAATDSWPVLLGAATNIHGPFQVMTDGVGGCACRYGLTTNNSDYAVVL